MFYARMMWWLVIGLVAGAAVEEYSSKPDQIMDTVEDFIAKANEF